MSGRSSRRDFIRRTSTLATTAAAVTALGRSARAFAANEKVLLGQIGIGGRGTELLARTMKNCPDARFAALCDLKPDRLDKALKVAERDTPKGYADYRKMMEAEKLDGIIVATEPNNHAALVVPVLEAGFNCFAEKPMDTTVEKIDAITRAARKAKGIYQIGTQRRYHPSYVAGAKLIHGGEIGKVTFMQGAWHWPWEPGMRTVERDGGELIEQASHHMDVMSWAVGNKAPVSCASMGLNILGKDPNTYSETSSATVYHFADGSVFSYTHLFYLPPHFTEEKLWVFGDKGGVALNEGMFWPRDGKATKEQQGKRFAEASGEDWNKGTAEEMCAFVAHVKSGSKELPAANVETGRICSLMCIMGRMAMANPATNKYEPRLIKWADLKSETDKA